MSISSAAIITNAIVLVMLTAGCDPHQSPESFRRAEHGAVWASILDSLHAPLDPVLPTVILVAPPTHCQSCIDELGVWMRDYWRYPIRLVWLAPAESDAEVAEFMQRNGFLFPVRRWTGSDALRAELLPFSPAKLLITPDRTIHRIQVVGMDPDFEAFLQTVADIGR
jgi:hypothetical protein